MQAHFCCSWQSLYSIGFAYELNNQENIFCWMQKNVSMIVIFSQVLVGDSFELRIFLNSIKFTYKSSGVSYIYPIYPGFNLFTLPTIYCRDDREIRVKKIILFSKQTVTSKLTL